jgi:hypothetical protein
MTNQRELTLKQWKRRALKAEAQLEFIQNVRSLEAQQELTAARERAAQKVALDEIREVLEWAQEQQA